MKINKRALLVESIIVYEIILNYIVYPLPILIEPVSMGAKILFNTLFFGVLVTLLAVAIGTSIYLGVYYLIKWINEGQQ